MPVARTDDDITQIYLSLRSWTPVSQHTDYFSLLVDTHYL
jgi:hypothetical protein